MQLERAGSFDLHCVLLGTDAGPGFRVALSLAARLGASGTDVALASVGGLLTEEQRANAAEAAGVELFEYPGPVDSADDLRQVGSWLQEMEERVQPDVVHLHDSALATFPFRRPLVLSPRIDRAAWYEVIGQPGDDVRSRQSAAGLQAADLVVAPSYAALVELERRYGTLAAATVVYDGPPADRRQGGPGAPLVLSARSTFDEGGRVGTLSAAAAGLGWPVASADPLGGDAAWAHHLESAAIFAQPVRYEPFGAEAADAALSGLALVLPDLPHFRELWDGAAVLVDPSDVVGWSAALRRLVADERLRRTLASAAHARAREHGNRAMADGYRAAYARIVHPEAGEGVGVEQDWDGGMLRMRPL